MLHAFMSGTDGSAPWDGVALDGSGNVYGVAESGGTTGCGSGCGLVFEITP